MHSGSFFRMITNSFSNDLNKNGLLFERRDSLCLKFAKASLKNTDMRSIFPLNDASSTIDTRFREPYKVTNSRTERLKTSAVPFMQRLLNSDARKK